MQNSVTIFIPQTNLKENEKTIKRFQGLSLVKEIILISSDEKYQSYENVRVIHSKMSKSSETVKLISQYSSTKFPFILLIKI